ncbi:MAG: Ppx/GppA family phosphatase [Pyrinomonadaceae bacterium]|nr:Ppx/GppA family phosphatase [Pyrinomonadaceae bacterium]
MKLAAIDVGSNSIKLVVVEATSENSIALLAREKQVVRLGRGTLREHYLAPAAINRAAETIKQFRSTAEAHNADRVIAIATASVREASNAAEFIEEVERQTGVRVEVLSGIEEARLIGLAAWHGCGEGHCASLINIDIGGGSTELSLVQNGTPAYLSSLKLGAVGFTERFLASDPVKAKELRALQEEIRGALERPTRELRSTKGAEWQEATGTSGTIIAIGEALALRRPRATDAKAVPPASGTEITLDGLERLNKELAGLSVAERRRVPGISQQRAEIIIAGGQILEGVMRALDIQGLRVCEWALREGVIIDHLQEMNAEQRSLVPDIAEPRLRGVRAVGVRFGYEEAHANQVALLAHKMFDELIALHGLDRHHRTLLSAAALLHDVGYAIAHESHHKHSLYIIKHTELTGFSEAERLLIANVARYHRGALPKERHPDFALLKLPDREAVWQLGGILRLADALDRNHQGRVLDLRCTRDGQTMHLELQSSLPCAEELWAAELKRDMFEQAFMCKVLISRRAVARRA